MLIKLHDAVHVDLARRRVVQGLALGREVDRVEVRLVAQALQQLPLDLGLRDQRRERVAVPRLDVRNERGGVVPELALGDELAWMCGGRRYGGPNRTAVGWSGSQVVN